MRFTINVEPVRVEYELYEDARLMNREVLEAPIIVHKQQYLQLIQHLINSPIPTRFIMKMPDDVIWDQFEQKQKRISNILEFKNLAWCDKYGRE